MSVCYILIFFLTVSKTQIKKENSLKYIYAGVLSAKKHETILFNCSLLHIIILAYDEKKINKLNMIL